MNMEMASAIVHSLALPGPPLSVSVSLSLHLHLCPFCIFLFFSPRVSSTTKSRVSCHFTSAPRLVPYHVDHLVPVEPSTFPPRPPRPPIYSYPTFQSTPNSILWSDLVWSCSRVPVTAMAPTPRRSQCRFAVAVDSFFDLCPTSHLNALLPNAAGNLAPQPQRNPKPKLPRQVCLSIKTISLAHSRAEPPVPISPPSTTRFRSNPVVVPNRQRSLPFPSSCCRFTLNTISFETCRAFLWFCFCFCSCFALHPSPFLSPSSAQPCFCHRPRRPSPFGRYPPDIPSLEQKSKQQVLEDLMPHCSFPFVERVPVALHHSLPAWSNPLATFWSPFHSLPLLAQFRVVAWIPSARA